MLKTPTAKSIQIKIRIIMTERPKITRILRFVILASNSSMVNPDKRRRIPAARKSPIFQFTSAVNRMAMNGIIKIAITIMKTRIKFFGFMTLKLDCYTNVKNNFEKQSTFKIICIFTKKT